MKKRFFSLLMIIVLVLGCLSLTGCGGQEKESGGDSTGAQEEAVDSSAAPEVTVEALFARAKDIEGMSYDFIAQSDAGEMSGKFWIQGDKFKCESTTEGQKVISIFDGATVYNYVPAENLAFKVSMDQIQQPETPLEQTEEVNDGNVKIVETTVYDGVECVVVLFTDPDGTEEAKMWVREDYGIPVRVETKGGDGSTAVMEYKNLEIGPQPAGTFELPAGVEVMDMNQMMEQMPDMSQVPGS